MLPKPPHVKHLEQQEILALQRLDPRTDFEKEQDAKFEEYENIAEDLRKNLRAQDDARRAEIYNAKAKLQHEKGIDRELTDDIKTAIRNYATSYVTFMTLRDAIINFGDIEKTGQFLEAFKQNNLPVPVAEGQPEPHSATVNPLNYSFEGPRQVPFGTNLANQVESIVSKLESWYQNRSIDPVLPSRYDDTMRKFHEQAVDASHDIVDGYPVEMSLAGDEMKLFYTRLSSVDPGLWKKHEKVINLIVSNTIRRSRVASIVNHEQASKLDAYKAQIGQLNKSKEDLLAELTPAAMKLLEEKREQQEKFDYQRRHIRLNPNKMMTGVAYGKLDIDNPASLTQVLLTRDLLDYGLDSTETEELQAVKTYEQLIDFHLKRASTGRGMIPLDPSFPADAALSQRRVILAGIQSLAAQMHKNAEVFELFDKVPSIYNWAKIVELEFRLILDARFYEMAPFRPHHIEQLKWDRVHLELTMENSLRRFSMAMAVATKPADMYIPVDQGGEKPWGLFGVENNTKKPTAEFTSVYDLQTHKYADYDPYDEAVELMPGIRDNHPNNDLPYDWIERKQAEIKARWMKRVTFVAWIAIATLVAFIVWKILEQLIQLIKKGDVFSRLGRAAKRSLFWTLSCIDRLLYGIREIHPANNEGLGLIRLFFGYKKEDHWTALEKESHARSIDDLIARRSQINAELLRNSMMREATAKEKQMLADIERPWTLPTYNTVRRIRAEANALRASVTDMSHRTLSKFAVSFAYAHIKWDEVVDRAIEYSEKLMKQVKK